jgi:hypothetical protein
MDKASSYQSVLFPIISGILLCLLFIGNVNASEPGAGIDFIPSDKGYVGQDTRQTSIYYHNNSLDQLWYGTDAWAVKFDVGDITGIDSLMVQSLSVYFPQDEGTFDLKIYREEFQPLDSLAVAYDNIEISQGWNSFPLIPTDYVTGSVFWVVIEYETGSDQNRFMGASAVDGSQSYFWVPPEGDIVPGYFANMAESNISSEFLVTLAGILYSEDESYDLELSSFRFLGNFNPRGNIYPELTIRNNSGTHIDDLIGVSVRLSNPAAAEWNVTIPLDLDLAAGADTTYVLDLPQYTHRLLAYPSQYRLRAELQYDDDSYSPNNLILFSFNNFQLEREHYLTEFFLRSDDQSSMTIFDNQQTLAADSLFFINYFFNAADQPYFIPDAALKKDFYGLSGYPFTIVEGEKRIGGYFTGYTDSLTTAIESSSAATFLYLVDDSMRKYFDPEHLLVDLDFTLKNDSTYIFPGDLTNLKMNLALVENVSGSDDLLSGPFPIYLNRFEGLGTLTLGYGLEQSFNWTHNLQTVGTIFRDISEENREHFDLIYWLQDSITKKVYYTGTFNLGDFDLMNLDAEDLNSELISPLVTLYPNPAGRDGAVNFSFAAAREMQAIRIEIFNIKGQLVRELTDKPGSNQQSLVWDIRSAAGKRSGSGIYFARIETLSSTGRRESFYRKFVILP